MPHVKEWGDEEDEGDEGDEREGEEELLIIAQCPMPHAPCPMPNTSLREAAPTATLSISAQCPMPLINMIPISDNIRCRNKPIINYWLIGINVAVFLWELQLEFSGGLGNFINSWGVIPAQISGAITNALSYNNAAWIIVIWRIFSLVVAIFLHGSFSQILGNLLFLWVFGKTVENILGHRRYLGLYLAAGAIAFCVQILAEPSLTVPLIGGNGAIAAVLGAYILKFPKAKIDTILPLIILYIPIELPAFFYLFWWFVQQFFYGIGSLNIPPVGVNHSGVVFWGQVVGLLIGAGFIRLKR